MNEGVVWFSFRSETGKKSPEDKSTLNEVYLLFSVMQNIEKYVWQVTSKILFNSITFFLSLKSIISINALQIL